MQRDLVIAARDGDLDAYSQQGAENRGMMISRGSSPVLSGNTSCGNGDNVYVLDGTTPEDDDTNEFCADVATPE